MHARLSEARPARGFMLIEALVAILIFALGVLGMVAMGSTAISTQSDGRLRTDAAALADEIASSIAFNLDRGTSVVAATNALAKAASLASFAYLPAGDPASCAFSGGGAVNPIVTAWLQGSVETGPRRLPGATDASAQIVVNTAAGGMNRVQITLCWKAPTDVAMRHHTLVTYVN